MPQLRLTVAAPLTRIRPTVESALAAEGFGVLTEVDVQAIFRAKLDVDHEGHRILGVCNPRLAKSALDVDRDVALLLPCTVTLREVEGGTEIHVLDPEAAFALAAPATRERLTPLAAEAAQRLARVLNAVASTARS